MGTTNTTDAGRATGLDDPDFAARVRERDAESLQEVVRAYLPQVLRAARGAGLPPQLAEDVTQDTFVTFIETAHRFEGRSHVRTWLFGILYKKDAARRLRRDQEMDDIDDVFEQRMAFVLREVEGMDTREICKILEVTRTNLGVLLHRVRNRLRECLEAKGIEP